jgi:hypothetical protein
MIMMVLYDLQQGKRIGGIEMYILIYDCDDCKGIEEQFDTWQEAKDAMDEYKEYDGYYNFSIIGDDSDDYRGIDSEVTACDLCYTFNCESCFYGRR